MKGDGKGNLGLPSSIPAPTGDVLTADLNGDGHPGLVVSGSVLLNQGNGTFSPYVSYATGFNSEEQRGLGLADLNGDGHPDMIFAANNSSGNGELMVAYGNADGTFSAASAVANISIRVGSAIAGVADLHGDGKARALIASEDGITTALGATPPGLPLYAASLYRYTQALTADFNRDGIADIAVPADNSIIILFGKADGTFEAATSVPALVTVGGLAVADTNGDGFPDATLGRRRLSRSW